MKRLFSLLTLLAFVASAMVAQEKTTIDAQTKPMKVEKEIVKPSKERPAPTTRPVEAVTPTTRPVVVATDGPKMTFELTTMDYGTIEQNSNGVRTFPFVNDGTEPLLIKYAKGSCGCTVPKYPKEPIMPGESAVIEVRYDTKRVGAFSKNVRLTTNVQDQPIMLYIKGKVNKAPVGLPAKSNTLQGF